MLYYNYVYNVRRLGFSLPLSYGALLNKANLLLKVNYEKRGFTVNQPWVAYRYDDISTVPQSQVKYSYGCFSRAEGLSIETLIPLNQKELNVMDNKTFEDYLTGE